MSVFGFLTSSIFQNFHSFLNVEFLSVRNFCKAGGNGALTAKHGPGEVAVTDATATVSMDHLTSTAAASDFANGDHETDEPAKSRQTEKQWSAYVKEYRAEPVQYVSQQVGGCFGDQNCRGEIASPGGGQEGFLFHRECLFPFSNLPPPPVWSLHQAVFSLTASSLRPQVEQTVFQCREEGGALPRHFWIHDLIQGQYLLNQHLSWSLRLP